MTTSSGSNKRRWDPFSFRGLQVTLLIGVPAVAFVLLGAGLRVSTCWHDETLLVRGNGELVAGWPAALRLSLLEDDRWDVKLLAPTRVRGVLIRDRRSKPLFDIPIVEPIDSIPVGFRVPAVAAGPAVIELEIHFAGKARSYELPVVITEEPAADAIPMPTTSFRQGEGVQVVKGKERIELFTEDLAAPAGLDSLLFLRTTGDLDDPRPASIELEVPDGSGAARKSRFCLTDRFGLAALEVNFTGCGQPVTALGSRYVGDDFGPLGSGATEAVPNASLHPEIRQGGITATVAEPIVGAGQPIRIAVTRVGGNGPVHADLFRRDQLVAARSLDVDGTETDVELAATLPGLHRIRITANGLAGGGNDAARHVYVLGKGETRADGLRGILTQLIERGSELSWATAALALLDGPVSPEETRLAASFAVARLRPEHREAPLLLNSRVSEKASIAAAKASYHRNALAALALLALGVLIQLGTLAARGLVFRPQTRRLLTSGVTLAFAASAVVTTIALVRTFSWALVF